MITLYSMPRERKTWRSRTSRPTTSQRGSPAVSRCSFHTRRANEDASRRLSASSQYWISARPAAYFSECRKGRWSLSRRRALRTIRGSTSSPATVTVTCHNRPSSPKRSHPLAGLEHARHHRHVARGAGLQRTGSVCRARPRVVRGFLEFVRLDRAECRGDPFRTAWTLSAWLG